MLPRCCRALPGVAGYLPARPPSWSALGQCRVAGYCRVLPGTAGYCRVLPGTAGYCRVLPGTAGYCRVLPGCRVGAGSVPGRCRVGAGSLPGRCRVGAGLGCRVAGARAQVAQEQGAGRAQQESPSGPTGRWHDGAVPARPSACRPRNERAHRQAGGTGGAGHAQPQRQNLRSDRRSDGDGRGVYAPPGGPGDLPVDSVPD